MEWPNGGAAVGSNFFPWLWADTNLSTEAFSNPTMAIPDTDMDREGEVNWMNWMASAKGIQ